MENWELEEKINMVGIVIIDYVLGKKQRHNTLRKS